MTHSYDMVQIICPLPGSEAHILQKGLPSLPLHLHPYSMSNMTGAMEDSLRSNIRNPQIVMPGSLPSDLLSLHTSYPDSEQRPARRLEQLREISQSCDEFNENCEYSACSASAFSFWGTFDVFHVETPLVGCVHFHRRQKIDILGVSPF